MTDGQFNLLEAYRPTRFAHFLGNAGAKARFKSLRTKLGVRPGLLVSGAFGAGKTSFARVAARSIVCKAPSDGFEPCGVCETCKGYEAGKPQVIRGIHYINCAGIGLSYLKEFERDELVCSAVIDWQ